MYSVFVNAKGWFYQRVGHTLAVGPFFTEQEAHNAAIRDYFIFKGDTP